MRPPRPLPRPARPARLALLAAVLAPLAPLACGGAGTAPQRAPGAAGSSVASVSSVSSAAPSSASSTAASSAGSAATGPAVGELAWLLPRCEQEAAAKECTFAGILSRAEPAKAAALFRRACALDVQECVAAADALRGAEPPLKDAALLLDLLGEACARGADGEECRALGRACAKPPYAAADFAARCGALDAECEKAPRRCVAAATYAWNQEGERAKLDERALGLAQKACTAGVAAGCRQRTSVAVAQLTGEEGHAKDPAKARLALERQCAAKEPLACSALGAAYDTGKGVPRDRAKARAMREQACASGGPPCTAAMQGAIDGLAEWDAKTFAATWDRLAASCKTAKLDCPQLESLADRFAASAPPAERAHAKERAQAVVDVEGPRVWTAMNAAWGAPGYAAPMELEGVVAWMKKACAAGAPLACKITACSGAQASTSAVCVERKERPFDRAACEQAKAAEAKACASP